MAFVAPWLVQNNPLDFMRQGAALGLQIRAQRAAEEQALARNELAQQELAQQRELAAARAAEALRQHNALEAYRKEQTALGERRLDAQERRQAAAEKRQVAADALRFGTQASASNFFKDLQQDTSIPGFDYDEGNPYERITRNPMAINHPAVTQTLRQWEINQRDASKKPSSVVAVPIINPATGEVIQYGRPTPGGDVIPLTPTPTVKPPATTAQIIQFQKDRLNTLKQQPALKPGSPEAFASTNLVNALEAALKAVEASAAPLSGTKKRFRYDESTGKVVEVQ